MKEPSFMKTIKHSVIGFQSCKMKHNAVKSPFQLAVFRKFIHRLCHEPLDNHDRLVVLNWLIPLLKLPFTRLVSKSTCNAFLSATLSYMVPSVPFRTFLNCYAGLDQKKKTYSVIHCFLVIRILSQSYMFSLCSWCCCLI